MRKRVAEWVQSVNSLYDYKFIMITLTYAPEFGWKPNHIREFMLSLKKVLGNNLLAYAWVAELQKRGVIHYNKLSKKKETTMTDFLYNMHGTAVGFWDDGFIYAMNGKPIGQIDGSHVHKLSGSYVGELYEDMVVDMHIGNVGNIGNPGNPGNPGNLGNPGNRGPINYGFQDVFYKLLE
jgi:hypothetical protein